MAFEQRRKQFRRWRRRQWRDRAATWALLRMGAFRPGPDLVFVTAADDSHARSLLQLL